MLAVHKGCSNTTEATTIWQKAWDPIQSGKVKAATYSRSRARATKPSPALKRFWAGRAGTPNHNLARCPRDCHKPPSCLKPPQKNKLNLGTPFHDQLDFADTFQFLLCCSLASIGQDPPVIDIEPAGDAFSPWRGPSRAWSPSSPAVCGRECLAARAPANPPKVLGG